MSSADRIAINGRVLSSRAAGIARHAREIISRLSLDHVVIRPRWGGRGVPGHAWEQLVLPARLEGRLLWSPANTGPVRVRRQLVTIHDLFAIDHPELFSPQFARLYRWVIPKVVREAAHVVAVSLYTKERLVERTGISPEKVTVIHNGVGPSFHPRGEDQVAAAKLQYRITFPRYLVALSTIEPRKNMDRILHAWGQVCPDLPDTGMVIVGASGNPRVFRETGLNGIPSRVQFTGRVADEALPALLSGATALVFPSLYEGFGIPAIEAMACGCPVITSRSSALPEICGDAAVFVNPRDVEEIGEAVVRVSGDAGLREALRSLGRQRASLYSWDLAAAQMSHLMNELAAEGSQGPLRRVT